MPGTGTSCRPSQNHCVLQVSYLILTSQMLVEMKVKELRYKARQRARQEKGVAQESKKDS